MVLGGDQFTGEQFSVSGITFVIFFEAFQAWRGALRSHSDTQGMFRGLAVAPLLSITPIARVPSSIAKSSCTRHAGRSQHPQNAHLLNLLQPDPLHPPSLDKHNRRRKVLPAVKHIRNGTKHDDSSPDGRRPVGVSGRGRLGVRKTAHDDDKPRVGDRDGVDGQAPAAQAPPRRREVLAAEAAPEHAADGE